tara:strand:- start:6224 stop:7570 length:1347 start_codon:yes stop_codon:yes gene_type:complete
MPIAIMAGTLEVGKLLTASWLYRYWDETSILIRSYLTVAVVVLMLITSMGIFGYLSKAHLDQAGASGDAFAIVERIEGQVAREENKITILEDRIASLQTGGGIDVSSSIQQQAEIRDGAWERVQGDIDYAQGQIQSIRDQLVIDLKAQDDKLIPLDSIVDSYAEQGTVTTGSVFNRNTTDNVAKANEVRQEQKAERDAIADEKNNLRTRSQTDINIQQANIDKYRAQAQNTIQDANNEINKLRDSSSADQDEVLVKIDNYNEQIDTIYDGLVLIKDEKFEAESEVRILEKEVGPIKYVAQLIYGDDSPSVLDQAVRLFILLLVFVFDPLAIMLLLAANQTLLRYGVNLEGTDPKNSKPTPPQPVDSVPYTHRMPVPDSKKEEVLKGPKVPVEEPLAKKPEPVIITVSDPEQKRALKVLKQKHSNALKDLHSLKIDYELMEKRQKIVSC